MSRIAEGDAETACPLTCEPPRPHPDTPQWDQAGDCPGRVSAGGHSGSFGSKSYAREELVAEMAGAFVWAGWTAADVFKKSEIPCRIGKASFVLRA